MKGSWEAELEDKYTATIPFNEDVRVLILHQIAQITLRRNFINELKVQFPDMLEIENDLEEMLAKSDQEIIPEMLKGQNSDLLILDYEMY